MISLVVARSRNGVIGRDGGLPWRLPSDLKHFKRLTTGGTVVMGRRTFESLPAAFRPLPERRNLVLSSDAGLVLDGAEVLPGLDAVPADCFVIGGGVTYLEALPLAGRVHATEIEADVDGDAYFPELAEDEWRCVEESGVHEENGYRFSFRTYER